MSFPSLVRRVLAFVAIASAPAAAQFESEISAWVTQDDRNPPAENSVLFIGASTIRGWESLTYDFADYNVIQRGYGGASLTDLERNLENIVLPYDPAAVVMLTRSRETDEASIRQDYIDFFNLIHSSQRQDRDPIPILFVGGYPRLTTFADRWANVDQKHNVVAEEIAADNDHIYFVDTASRMLDTAEAAGQPPAEHLFATDRHHLNADGYAFWQPPIREALEAVITPNKVYQSNAAGPLLGERILFDFGSRPTDGPDANGNLWNDWHTDTGSLILAGQSVGNLTTTEGRDTGIDLVITGEFNVSSSGLREPEETLLGSLAIESATRDMFVPGSVPAERGMPNAGFMLTGLEPDLQYDLRFFASRRSSRNHIARYSVVGADDAIVQDLAISSAENGANSNTTVDFDGIRPDAFGQIFVDLQPVNGQHNGYLGIMELSVAVPEPSSMTMLIVAVIGIAIRHRYGLE